MKMIPKYKVLYFCTVILYSPSKNFEAVDLVNINFLGAAFDAAALPYFYPPQRKNLRTFAAPFFPPRSKKLKTYNSPPTPRHETGKMCL